MYTYSYLVTVPFSKGTSVAEGIFYIFFLLFLPLHNLYFLFRQFILCKHCVVNFTFSFVYLFFNSPKLNILFY